MVTQTEGDLLDANAEIICHQCNCCGRMGSGVALAVKNRFPEVFDAYYKDYEMGLLKLGYVCYAPTGDGRVIANMCGQENYGYDGKKYTHYDKLQQCMDRVKSYAQENGYKRIAFPYLMSCHLGGGDWNIVSKMIETTFADFDVEIRRLKKEG